MYLEVTSRFKLGSLGNGWEGESHTSRYLLVPSRSLHLYNLILERSLKTSDCHTSFLCNVLMYLPLSRVSLVCMVKNKQLFSPLNRVSGETGALSHYSFTLLPTKVVRKVSLSPLFSLWFLKLVGKVDQVSSLR